MPARRPIDERFLEKIDKSGGPDACWNWTARLHNGYGRIGSGSGDGHTFAHRYSWERENGPIPDELCVLHRCDNRRCVNPKHLFLGDRADNLLDMDMKGRRAMGLRHGRSRLTHTMVMDAYNSIESQSACAERLGVSQTLVSKIRLGKIWREVTKAYRVGEKKLPVRSPVNGQYESQHEVIRQRRALRTRS